MRIWAFKLGEPVQSDGGSPRLLRTGIICEILAERGHEIVWWTSVMNHAKKEVRFPNTEIKEIRQNYTQVFLNGRKYTKNVSFKRILHHRDATRGFLEKKNSFSKPDIILCSLPLLELCHVTTTLGKRWKIPVIIDVRDFWPDIIIDIFPIWLQGIARLGCFQMTKQLEESVEKATAICGISDGAIEWALSYTGRRRTSLDKAFPLSYRSQKPKEEDIHEAEQFWDKKGIVRSEDHLNICYFGNLSNRHDLETLFNAAHILNKKEKKINFILCGTGEALEKLNKNTATLNCVQLPGWVDAAQIWSLLRRSNLGIAPYPCSRDYKYSIPNKVVEYFSAGLPVVTGLKGDLSRLIEHEKCGLLYENGHPESLVDVLERVSNDRKILKEMSRRTKLVFENYRAEKIYGEFCDYLENISGTKSH